MSAVRELRSALERLPNDRVIQTELALALWQLGEGRGAVAVLTTVLDNDGGDATALQARGEILADLGEARAALLDLDRMNAYPRPSTRAARALALAQLGDLAGAQCEISAAREAAPRNGLVLWYAARISVLSGDDAEAVDLASQAASAVDPALSPQHQEEARKLEQQLV
jgi:Flp pilus assembly protein TadD